MASLDASASAAITTMPFSGAKISEERFQRTCESNSHHCDFSAHARLTSTIRTSNTEKNSLSDLVEATIESFFVDAEYDSDCVVLHDVFMETSEVEVAKPTNGTNIRKKLSDPSLAPTTILLVNKIQDKSCR
jgi:hypothetical protein